MAQTVLAEVHIGDTAADLLLLRAQGRSCATEVPADAVRCWGVPSKCCFDENKQPKYQAKNIRAFS